MRVRLDELTIDPEVQLQTRGVDREIIGAYVEAIANDAQMPPVVVFCEDGHKWLADGFHRVEATRFLGLVEIEAEVKDGTRQDALVFAATANVTNGKPMSQAEKREAAERLFEHTVWSAVKISQELAVARRTVDGWKLSWQKCHDDKRVVIVTRNGTTYQMDTTNIGPRGLTFTPDPDFGELVHGPIGNYRERNGTKQCEKCGNLWATDLDYCPYCNISQEARVLYAQREGRDRPHVSHNSGNNEWYTPSEYIEAARQVMGDIDLDPASSEIANRTVQARTFYTQDDDGLLYDWQGRVWMNPPYASHLIGLFADKLAEHVRQGDISQACVLVNNATETGWFNTLWGISTCFCFIRGRVKFIDEEGNPSGAPLQGQVIFYIGGRRLKFAEVFEEFGPIGERFSGHRRVVQGA